MKRTGRYLSQLWRIPYNRFKWDNAITIDTERRQVRRAANCVECSKDILVIFYYYRPREKFEKIKLAKKARHLCEECEFEVLSEVV